MWKVHRFIDQGVRDDIVLAINVIHGLMNSPIRQRVAKLGAGAEVRPQIRGAACGLPATEDDHLARDQLGIQFEYDPAVDVGVPQLSMHSVREMMGTEDVDICHKHFVAFYENIAKVDASVQMSS